MKNKQPRPTIELDKKDLKKIHAALPYGSQIKIARETKYSPEYVNAVLRGDVPTNVEIILEAQKLIREKKERDERVLDKIKKQLND